MLDFVCQRCGITYHAEESHTGKMIRCRQCGELVTVTAPLRPLMKCAHCDRPMDAPEGHALCGANGRQARGSIFRFPRRFTVGGRQYTKRDFALLFASVLVLLFTGFVLNPVHIFRQGGIRSNGEEVSSRTSIAQPPAPAADSQPSSPADNTACGINDTGGSSTSLPNGTEIRKRRRVSRDGDLEVQNGASTDAVVYLVDFNTKELVRNFYVQANNAFTESNIAPGVYRLVFATGRGWNSGTRSFDRCAAYRQFDETLDYSESKAQATGRVGSWHYRATLQPVVNGNARTTPIDKRLFDQMVTQPD